MIIYHFLKNLLGRDLLLSAAVPFEMYSIDFEAILFQPPGGRGDRDGPGSCLWGVPIFVPFVLLQ